MPEAAKFSAALTATLILISACAGPSADEPAFDSATDAEGKVIWLDTEKNWDVFTRSIDQDMEREASGRRPQAGYVDWNHFWITQLRNLNNANIENRERYVGYIHQRRTELFLPPLPEDRQ